MSRVNQKRTCCFHEAGHAVMAWLEGVPISLVRMVPEDEPNEEDGVTQMDVPVADPKDWTVGHIISHMRITLAGPEGEKFGPFPGSGTEREFAKVEAHEHELRAMQWGQQFGSHRLDARAIARLVMSAKQDVKEVFRKGFVIGSVEAVAAELFRRKSIAGCDAEAIVASRISAEQREEVRIQCCLTGKRVNGITAPVQVLAAMPARVDV